MKTPQPVQLYCIVRYFREQGKRSKITKRGLTLEEAQSHCSDPKTRIENVHFDGYTKQAPFITE